MYFKITNQDECHHGYQYQTGLNILDKPFEMEGSCVPGGLYFTDLENLHKFYGYGVWLRVVIIPGNAVMVEDPSGGKWRADKIILGHKHALFDVETIKKFNLEVNEHFIACASGGGHVDALEWWKSSGLELKYSSDAMYWASENGHVDVLEWWKSSGLPLKYTMCAINHASRCGHVDVLEWWKNSGLDLKYDERSMDYASRNGHVSVLEWWLRVHKSSGLPLK